MTRIIKKIDGYSDRALAIEKDGYRFLVSYNTVIAYQDKDGAYHRTWGGYSNTSKKHANLFGMCVNKKEWERMEVEELPFNLEVEFDGVIYRNIKGYSDNLSIYSKSAYGF